MRWRGFRRGGPPSHGGGWDSGIPLAMSLCQREWCRSLWWRPHRATQFPTLVGPSSACSATAAAVAQLGSTGAPLSPRPGSTSAAAATRARASPRGTRPTARISSTVVGYPTVAAVPGNRFQRPPTAFAQVECNWVSNAPNSATNAASQSCHTGAVDMTQFYNEALPGPHLNVGDQTPKLSLIIRRQ
jgi:hypothetical protein